MSDADHQIIADNVIEPRQLSTPTSSGGSSTPTNPHRVSDASPARVPSSNVSASAAFPCALCPAAFADGLALAVHERTHGAAFRCSLCARSFRLEGDLLRHRRRHGTRDTGRLKTVRAVDSVSVNGRDERAARLAEGRMSPEDRVVVKDSGAEMVVVRGVGSESGSAEHVFPATTVAPAVHASHAESHKPQLEDNKPQEDHAPQAENYAPQAENHAPQAENHAPLTANISRAIELSGLPSNVLDLPFQCAVCSERFDRVSRLQRHVKSHAPTGVGTLSEGEVTPRRSQRRRTARRTIGESGASDCDSGSDGDGAEVFGKGTARRKSHRRAPTVAKRPSRGGKDAGKLSRVAASHPASSGTKSVASLSVPPGDVNCSRADTETNTGTSPVRKDPGPTRVADDDVLSGTLSNPRKTQTPSTNQRTATTAATTDRRTQRTNRRRAAPPPLALVEDDESDVDDAPALSSPPPPPPPAASSSTQTHTTITATPPGLTPPTPVVSSEGVTASHCVPSRDAVSSSVDETTSPPGAAEMSAEAAPNVEHRGERTEAAGSAPASGLSPTEAETHGEFECDVCFRRLSHRHALARHRRMHFARETFQCDQCPRRYSRLDTLVMHSRKHASEATHRCQICSKTYRLRSLLEYHMREHQKEGTKRTANVESSRFGCTECGKTFTYLTALRRHARMHVSGRIFCCEVCPKRYTRFDALVLHSRVHSKLTPFECVICARRFSQRRILEYHASSHASAVSIPQPPFKCELCSRSFSDPAQLREHRLRHQTSRSFLCDMCGKEFPSDNKLRRHVMTHTGERPLHCDICDRSFRDRTALVQHRRIHSGERPYQCHVCGKSFSRNRTLKIHSRTHSGEKPHSCGVCGRAFATVTQLTRHTRVHSGDKPYQCMVCGREFTQSSHRNVHMRTHAPRPGTAPAIQEEEDHHQQQQSVTQLAPPPVHEPHQHHQLQHQPHHQPGQEHHELYTLQPELPVVAPMDIEEGNMTLHFIQQ